MDLIIGGAYQGKLDYARREFGITDAEICICTAETEPDITRRCLVHYEQYLLGALRRGETRYLGYRKDAVIIADDIFCGIVPMDPEVRAWREQCGRALTAVAARAQTVTRLFCGLPMRIKE